jgi:membrane protein required for colicin V production
MNWLDIIMICFAGLLVVNGIRKGFIISFATLVALVLGIYAAVHFSNYLEGILTENLNPGKTWLPILSFTFTFLIVVILVMLLAKGLEKLIDLVGMGFFNRFFGALFGLLKSIFLLSVIFFIINSYDPKGRIIHAQIKERSVLYGYVEKVFPFLMKAFRGEIRFPEHFPLKPKK